MQPLVDHAQLALLVRQLLGEAPRLGQRGALALHREQVVGHGFVGRKVRQPEPHAPQLVQAVDEDRGEQEDDPARGDRLGPQPHRPGAALDQERPVLEPGRVEAREQGPQEPEVVVEGRADAQLRVQPLPGPPELEDLPIGRDPHMKGNHRAQHFRVERETALPCVPLELCGHDPPEHLARPTGK